MKNINKDNIRELIQYNPVFNNEDINIVWNFCLTCKYLNNKFISKINKEFDIELLNEYENSNYLNEYIYDENLFDIFDFCRRNYKSVPKAVSIAFFKHVSTKKYLTIYEVTILPFLLNYFANIKADKYFQRLVKYYETYLADKFKNNYLYHENGYKIKQLIDIEYLIFEKFNNPTLMCMYINLKGNATKEQINKCLFTIKLLSSNDINSRKYNQMISKIQRMLYSNNKK